MFRSRCRAGFRRERLRSTDESIEGNGEKRHRYGDRNRTIPGQSNHGTVLTFGYVLKRPPLDLVSRIRPFIRADGPRAHLHLELGELRAVDEAVAVSCGAFARLVVTAPDERRSEEHTSELQSRF